ncbi:hypothetical protein QJS10_CPA08g01403 [Acorus calamus]|uniref:Uncharacterized protein n=1 Tax=Acorus calamus TaxID=4465 RepID=A0AAV9EBE5_ACOCL|nr:hypothetical protein QJS10_CPA08g01403 [Acorus calamus]
MEVTEKCVSESLRWVFVDRSADSASLATVIVTRGATILSDHARTNARDFFSVGRGEPDPVTTETNYEERMSEVRRKCPCPSRRRRPSEDTIVEKIDGVLDKIAMSASSQAPPSTNGMKGPTSEPTSSNSSAIAHTEGTVHK